MREPSLFGLLKARVADLGVLEQTPVHGGGVTSGGFVRDYSDAAWYLKRHRDPDHAHIEHLANQVYRELGHHAPHSMVLHDPSDGHRAVYLSKKIEGFKTLDESGGWHGAIDPRGAAMKHVQGLAADALLGNGDTHGANVGLINRRAVARIDNGSALMYSPMGIKRDHMTVGLSSVGGRESHQLARELLDPNRHDPILERGRDHDRREAAFTHAKVLAHGFRRIDAVQQKHGGSWARFVDAHIPGASPALRAKAAHILDHRTNWLRGYVNGDHQDRTPDKGHLPR